MKLKVMLVNPPRVNGMPVVREERFEHKDIGSVYPPLSLLYMASILENNERCEVKLIDANGFDLSLENVIKEINAYRPDVVILRCGFDTQKEDIKVLEAAKSAGAVTVLRNKIIADVPEIRDEVLKTGAVDIFINSEPDAVISGLMYAIDEHKDEDPVKNPSDSTGLLNKDGDKDPVKSLSGSTGLSSVKGISFIRDGEIITTGFQDNIADLDCIPFPAYHLLPSLKVYHTGVMQPPFALVSTTRGCPYACTFCAYGKTKCRERSIESVINELKALKQRFNIKSFLFFDDTISIKGGRVEELGKRMIEEGLSGLDWVCCTRANLVNYDMLKVLKKAGMKEIAIGIETGSEEILKNIKKGVPLDSVRQAAKWCHELGIMFYGLAIIGLPGETEDTINETVKFIKEIDPFYTQFCFSVPFPNTEMYSYYEENGYLLTKEWDKYFPLSEEPVIRTEALSAEQLKKLRQKAYMKLLLRPGYLLKKIRPFDWKWNITGAIKIIRRIASVIKGKAVR